MNADNSCHAIVPKNDNVHNSGLRAPNTLNEAAISLALQTMLSGMHHVNALERDASNVDDAQSLKTLNPKP